jgi:hypothetical protein
MKLGNNKGEKNQPGKNDGNTQKGIFPAVIVRNSFKS